MKLKLWMLLIPAFSFTACTAAQLQQFQDQADKAPVYAEAGVKVYKDIEETNMSGDNWSDANEILNTATDVVNTVSAVAPIPGIDYVKWGLGAATTVMTLLGLREGSKRKGAERIANN